uniref:Putative conserved secreted protein n=1 Tax=Ixodes scapularis TaxID=6945 RepID=A0A4D5RS57_IXOSC
MFSALFFKLSLLLLSVTSIVLSSPVCYDQESSHKYRCLNFTNPDDFSEHVKRPILHQDLTFIVRNSRLSHLPARAFAGANVSVLEFDNVHLESFALQDENPFAGLETTLRKVIFSEGSTVPENWGLFANMLRLVTVRLSEITNLNLTSGFNQLPKSVRVITIAFSTIGYVDEHWVSELENLEAVGIRHCNLLTFSRSMLPKPALNLWRLDLYKNNLTSLPRHFTAEMPALTSLTFENNKITTFDEECLAPLAKNQSNRVRFGGNPLHCDCNLRFVLSYPTSWLNAYCVTPLALKHRPLKNVTEAQLCPPDEQSQ